MPWMALATLGTVDRTGFIHQIRNSDRLLQLSERFYVQDRSSCPHGKRQ